jgi:hypothetical protein
MQRDYRYEGMFNVRVIRENTLIARLVMFCGIVLVVVIALW